MGLDRIRRASVRKRSRVRRVVRYRFEFRHFQHRRAPTRAMAMPSATPDVWLRRHLNARAAVQVRDRLEPRRDVGVQPRSERHERRERRARRRWRHRTRARARRHEAPGTVMARATPTACLLRGYGRAGTQIKKRPPPPRAFQRCRGTRLCSYGPCSFCR